MCLIHLRVNNIGLYICFLHAENAAWNNQLLDQ
jgi:hypothetical protein